VHWQEHIIPASKILVGQPLVHGTSLAVCLIVELLPTACQRRAAEAGTARRRHAGPAPRGYFRFYSRGSARSRTCILKAILGGMTARAQQSQVACAALLARSRTRGWALSDLSTSLPHRDDRCQSGVRLHRRLPRGSAAPAAACWLSAGRGGGGALHAGLRRRSPSGLAVGRNG
jgi:hypothetical protein